MNRSIVRVWILLAFASLPPTVRAAPVDRLRHQEYPALEGRIVTQVLILGNNHTREVVFRREMRLEEGVPFRSEFLWRDRERILDLGLFAHVEVDAVPSGNGVLVVMSVFERPRWFAAPVADYDFDTERVSLGYRLRLRNLYGRNQSLRSSGKAGDSDRFSITWDDPWIGTHRQSLALSLSVELPREDNRELRTNSLGISTTRFLGDFRETRLGVTAFGRLEILERDGNYPGGKVDQVSPVIGVGLSRDKRNVRVDPSRGTFAFATTEVATGWTSKEISYLRTNLDARGFRSLPWGFIAAARLGTVVTSGRVPDYRLLGVGGSSSIRGQPQDVAVGANIGRASAELRFPIMDQRRFSLPIPFVPRRISNVDLRIAGFLFGDTGSAWDDAPGFREARFRSGYGLGLRLFLPIIELARIELAFDESGNPTFYVRDGNII
jgi:outer membrane protein assembly factor BamA